MTPQNVMATLLLLFLSLLDNALGAAVRVESHHPALPKGPCSYTTNGVGIASVFCFSPTDASRVRPSGHAGGHASGLSYNSLAAQLNTSWTSVTETYTTTSMDVIDPLNRTKTYTDLSTELTSTILDMRTTTQTVVEIAGYSTIDTYTTTFLAPASSSTYHMVETLTTTSPELLVPSVGTLTLTGSFPSSAQSFPTMSAQKRGYAWGHFENGTGVLSLRSLAKRSAWDNLTAAPSSQYTASAKVNGAHSNGPSGQVPPYLRSAALITQNSAPTRSADLSMQVESFDEHTRSSSTAVWLITVTNTYSITPTTKHKFKTPSQLKDSTTWLIKSPVLSNSTHHLPATLSTLNASEGIHATTTTMVSDSSSTMFRTTSFEVGMPTPAKATGTARPTSTSGGGVIFNGLVLHFSLAVLAAVLSLVV